MKIVSMSGSVRQNVGKKDAKALRREGKVPCVLYGGEEKQVIFAVAESDFTPLLFSPETHYVELTIEGNKTMAILQDIEYHPVNDKVLHADFLRIFDNKPITISVPVRTEGTAPGVLQGGKLNLKMRKVALRGLPNDIPQEIVLDISKLALNQSIKVADLKLSNVETMEIKNSVIVNVRTTRNVVETEETTAEGAEAPAEGAAAPAAEAEKK